MFHGLGDGGQASESWSVSLLAIRYLGTYLPAYGHSCLAAALERPVFLLDALRMAGLQPRFGAGSRRAKAWVSNELAVIDGVPRLSGPSHRTRCLLACSPRLHTVQHSTRAGTPQLPKMSPFQGCEPARPYCTVHLRLPPPFLEPRQCFTPRAAIESAPCPRGYAPGSTILSRAAHCQPDC